MSYPAIAWVMVGVGLALFTIGGLIQLAHNPKRLEEDIEGIREALRQFPFGHYARGVDLADPRGRLFYVPGLLLMAAGAVLLVVG